MVMGELAAIDPPEQSDVLHRQVLEDFSGLSLVDIYVECDLALPLPLLLRRIHSLYHEVFPPEAGLCMLQARLRRPTCGATRLRWRRWRACWTAARRAPHSLAPCWPWAACCLIWRSPLACWPLSMPCPQPGSAAIFSCLPTVSNLSHHVATVESDCYTKNCMWLPVRRCRLLSPAAVAGCLDTREAALLSREIF